MPKFKIDYTRIIDYKQFSTIVDETDVESARIYFESNLSQDHLLDDIAELKLEVQNA